MKIKSIYSLQRTMITYFLLIGFASILMGTEFLIDTRDPGLKNDLMVNFQQFASGKLDTEGLFAPIEALGNKVMLMITVIMAVTIIVLMMFIRNITEPLQYMIDNVREISAGDLRKTIHIRSNNELNELGKMINEMSSNLQEIILFSGKLNQAANNLVDAAWFVFQRDEYTPREIILLRRKLELLRNETEMLGEMLEYFRFYNVRNLDARVAKSKAAQ